MKPSTSEWVRKAEDDLIGARKLLSPLDGCYDLIAFSAQQCAEKYIKALLVEQGRSFPKEHELTILIQFLSPVPQELPKMIQDLAELSRMAVQVRYPGFDANVDSARHAVEIADRVRTICRAAIGLDET